MPQLEALGASWLGHPAGTDVAAAVAGSVETEAADGHEDMPVAGEDGDVFAGPRFAVILEPLAGHAVLQKAGIAQHMGSRAGTVQPVTAPSVAATELIGQMIDFVGRLNNALHRPGHTPGGICFAIHDHGAGTAINTFGVFGRRGAAGEETKEGGSEDTGLVGHGGDITRRPVWMQVARALPGQRIGSRPGCLSL